MPRMMIGPLVATLILVVSFGSSAIARALPQVTLSYPACFPSCSVEDQQRILHEGVVEGPVLAAIGEARREIRFSIYTFSRRPIFDALIAAQAERSVRIRGLVDRAQIETLNGYCPDAICDLSPLLPAHDVLRMSLQERMDLFAPLTIYQEASLVGKLLLLSWQHEDEITIRIGPGRSRLMHNKFVIIDDRVVQTSSGNWSSTAMSINFENRLEYRSSEDNAVIAAFSCAFEAIWQRQDNGAGGLLTHCGLANHIYFTPVASPTQPMDRVVHTAIASSQQSIAISMHHLTHPGIYSDLLEASERGVMIRLLFDDDDCPNALLADLEKLLRTRPDRVQMRYLPTQCKINQLSHNRFGIFDERLLINGSANWSLAGLRSNYETFQVYRDGSIVGAFQQHFERMYEAGLSRDACRCRLARVECRERYCRGEFNPF